MFFVTNVGGSLGRDSPRQGQGFLRVDRTGVAPHKTSLDIPHKKLMGCFDVDGLWRHKKTKNRRL